MLTPAFIWYIQYTKAFSQIIKYFQNLFPINSPVHKTLPDSPYRLVNLTLLTLWVTWGGLSPTACSKRGTCLHQDCGVSPLRKACRAVCNTPAGCCTIVWKQTTMIPWSGYWNLMKVREDSYRWSMLHIAMSTHCPLWLYVYFLLQWLEIHWDACIPPWGS